MKKRGSKIFIATVIFIFFVCSASYAQTLRGRVFDTKNVPIDEAEVYVDGGKYAYTDATGRFVVENVTSGAHKLLISRIGYQSQSYHIVAGESEAVTIYLVATSNKLEEVTVKGKTEVQSKRELGFSVEIIETKGFKNTNTNVNQLLKNTPGIVLRESGGLGSDFTLSLNGLSGNQVRTFVDGVPMEFFGSSLSLNNFPVNLIESIEVYKGVVPVSLSADALGGAINIRSSQKHNSFLDVAYSLGSFNTHRASVNAQSVDKKTGFIAKLKSFYNHSDNDYKIDVFFINRETGKLDTAPTNVKRFHDAYTSKMVWGELGVVDKAFADELLFGYMRSENYNEIQQNPFVVGTANIPLGAVFSSEDKHLFNFSYRKKGLLNDRLSLSAYAVFIEADSYFEDASNDRYDWYGNYTADANVSRGELELRKSKFTLTEKNQLANTNINYRLTDMSSLEFSLALNVLEMQGNDALHEAKNTQFSKPIHLEKYTGAVGYNFELFDSRLKSTAFYKHYRYSLESLLTNYQGTQEIPFQSDKQFDGFGFVTSYHLTAASYLKFSAERALRYPNSEELFGDGQSVESNPELLEEQSNNFNLSFHTRFTGSDRHRFGTSINVFYRDTKDYVRRQAIGVRSVFRNLSDVLGRGVEYTFSYQNSQHFSAFLNATYQNITNNSQWVNGVVGGQSDPLYKAKVPNTPTGFGNLTLNYNFTDVFQKGTTLSIQNQHNFVAKFSKDWERIGSQNKKYIPNSYATDLSFIFSTPANRYNISLTVSNLFNAKVYDNFEQQKPGSAFYLNLRYYLN